MAKPRNLDERMRFAGFSVLGVDAHAEQWEQGSRAEPTFETKVRVVALVKDHVTIEAERSLLFVPAGPFRAKVIGRVDYVITEEIRKGEIDKEQVGIMVTPLLAVLSHSLAFLAQQFIHIPLPSSPNVNPTDVEMLVDSTT